MRSIAIQILLVLSAVLSSAEGVSESDGTQKTQEPVDAGFSIPMTDLPDWVADPTQGGKYKGVFAVSGKEQSGEKDQRNRVLAVAKAKFTKAYPNEDATKLIQRSRYVDNATGLMFIWMVLPN